MKKICCTLLILVVALAGCGPKAEKAKGAARPTVATSDKGAVVKSKVVRKEQRMDGRIISAGAIESVSSRGVTSAIESHAVVIVKLDNGEFLEIVLSTLDPKISKGYYFVHGEWLAFKKSAGDQNWKLAVWSAK